MVWAYSTLKVDVATRPEFWAAVMSQLEAQCQSAPVFSEPNIYHSIIIAKGLSFYDPGMN